MSTKREIFEKVLTKEFSKDNFVQFSKEFFNDLKDAGQYTDNRVREHFGNYIESYTNIGNFMSEENKKISIFAIKIKSGKSVDGARSIQRNFVKALLERGNSAAGLAAFYTDDDKKWKLSLITLEYEFAKGKVIEKLTPAKRSSYLVGEGEPCHTALERLFPMFKDDNTNPTIDAMKEAFSVEKVTSEFFEKYSDKFYQVREYLEANKDFKQEAERHGFTSEQFTKKLMGQIAFLYFVQKKGWLGVNAFPKELTEREYKNYFYYSKKTKEIMEKIYIKSGDVFKRNTKEIINLSVDENEVISRVIKGDSWGNGPKDFMRKLFDDCIKKGKNYFDDYLEPLFYDALNKNRGPNAYFLTLHCRIPFLNGGLFEQLDNYDWKSNDFNIPNEMFSNRNEKGEYDADGILDVFDRYNFTISEDEPMEQEVAVDPEMLGKIFENLLEIRERKDKGAFYTPREIVHYMCQESLIQYLTEQTKISHEAISNFILYGEFLRDHDIDKQSTNKDGMLISKEIYDPSKNINRFDEIDKALKAVRVADPAVGSGAFPLGMLNEIVKAREVITGYLALERNKFDIVSMYAIDRNPYTLKSETIRDSIFAVDIEPSAVDIAKLRLWLSLIIDDQINPEADETDPLSGHKNPNPLPNLECNIICGDSLIDEIDGIKLITPSELFGDRNHQKKLSNNKYEGLLNQLFDLQYKLYHEDNHESKESTKKKIRSLIDIIVMFNLQTVSEDIKEKYRNYSKEHSLPFILWQLEFGRVFKEKSGFDIVIGNPPYISTKGVNNDSKKKYESAFGFSDDTYNLFFFKGCQLLNTSGTLTYITPKTFWTTQTKRNLRNLLLSKRINYIFDTANPFETAMVDTCVTSISNKEVNNNEIRFLDGSKNLSAPLKYTVSQEVYRNTQNSVIFKPTPENMRIYEKYGQKVKELYDKWWDKIKTSRDIEKNKVELETYRKNLKPGDVALLGCLTEGGQGLATANNGKYIAVRKSTKWAKNILESRPKKLAEAIQKKKIKVQGLERFSNTAEFLASLSEIKIAELFDNLKEKYGRDIFGQGYIYRLVDDSEIADVDKLTQGEKDNGIDTTKNFYVPYDKGDKDGNRWYLETPFAIAWSKENVRFLKTNSGKKGEGMPVVRNPQFYFREGLCWSDINTTFLKCRLKGKSINDVKSMSIFPLFDFVPINFIVCLINSTFMSYYVDNFVNNTQTFQINDARQLPIVVPTNEILTIVDKIFNNAYAIKKQQFKNVTSNSEAEQKLNNIQEELDKMVRQLYGLK